MFDWWVWGFCWSFGVGFRSALTVVFENVLGIELQPWSFTMNTEWGLLCRTDFETRSFIYHFSVRNVEDPAISA
jgi:hypothetical protein